MERFQISVAFSGKQYRMTAERKYLMSDTERWEVKAKNHTFQLECNRPLMIKKNLEHLPWEWKLIAGKCPDYFLKEIQQQIRKTIIRINK
jgi:hypothetical protein